MAHKPFDFESLAIAWNSLQSTFPVRLSKIRGPADHDRAVAFMNQLLDVVGDDEEHELADMLDLLGQLIEGYENGQYVLPDAEPAQVLRFLMDQHDLRQADLAAEVGSQSSVSEILSGRRQINARQAKALAQRFGVSAAAFI